MKIKNKWQGAGKNLITIIVTMCGTRLRQALEQSSEEERYLGGGGGRSSTLV